MTEGQEVAAASVPWGAACEAPPVPARQQAARGPAADCPELDEPHARVDARKLEAALRELRGQIFGLPLLLECPGIEEIRTERQQLVSQIDDYLLPRLRQPGAPILIAMVGSTGAGKSTLLNSIVGAQVSATGIRRPTTNSPVLACHPDDVRWFAENVFLPSLPRVRQQGLAMPGRDGLLVLATSEGMPEGVALLDTPDIDSVVAAHRQFARQFLDASDLWLFVTTARRYADAVVWELLRDARDRGASLGIVLSRVPPAAQSQLTGHFAAMLDANGLGDVQRFVIPETIVTDARLPDEVSRPVRRWLQDTARRDDRKVAILTQTMSGVLDTFKTRIPALAAQVEMQLALRAELRSAADAAYSAGLAEFDEATRSGSLLRGEVLARWQDFAGTGDLLRTLEVRKSRKPAQRSKRHAVPARAQALKAALRSSLEALVISVADRAAEDAIERWQASPAGAVLLAKARQPRTGSGQPEFSYSSLRHWQGDLQWTAPGAPGPQGVPEAQGALEVKGALDAQGLPGALDAHGAGLPDDRVDELARSSRDLAPKAARVVAGWQDHLLRLVQTENVTRRSIARVASFDPESLALVLTIGVLGYGAGDVIVSEGQRRAAAAADLTVRGRADARDRRPGAAGPA